MAQTVLPQSYEDGLALVAVCELGEPIQTLMQYLVQPGTPLLGDSRLGDLAVCLGLWRLNRHFEALQRLQPLEQGLSADPRYWILLGMVAKNCNGTSGLALHAYRKALALDDSRSDLHYNLANLLRGLDSQAAERAYKKSLAADPYSSQCWHNLGTLLYEQCRYDSSLNALGVSLLLDPLAANVWCDLGNAFQATDRLQQSLRSFEHAIALDRNHGPSHVNLGSALLCGLHPDRALEMLQRGVELEKSSSDSLWNLSLAYLHIGDYARGWDLYESRLYLKHADLSARPTSGRMPGSLDECLHEHHSPLVVWAEQGIGDSIQFCRYLALLDAAGVPFEFRVRPSLLRLFCEWTPFGDHIVEETFDAASNDCRPHIPLMSLPKFFRTTLPTIPGALPYLRPPGPPPTELQVPSPPGGLAVGLVWASDPANAAMYRRKSIPLNLLMPRLLQLVELDLIDLHSLQCGPDATQLDPWKAHPRITNWSPRLRDFADTAHVVQQLDLVISVDTAVAHLSGALRRPTWLLLPHAADFRWLQQRDDSPWYPGTMRLFRQPAPGDWPALVEQFHAALDALFLLDLQALAAHKLPG